MTPDARMNRILATLDAEWGFEGWDKKEPFEILEGVLHE